MALLELLEALARAANEAASPEAAMRTCLERISAYANWSFGRVAILKPDSNVPVVEASLWLGREPERFAQFVRVSESYDYAQLSGKFISVVLREKRAVWIEEFGKARAFGRLLEAVKAGLHSGFAFPIIVQGNVAAFLEFFAEEPRKADPLLLEAIGSVGAQLARLIERGRAEAVHARLAAIVAGSDDAIYSRALDGTVLSWNAGAERMFGYTAGEMIGRNISVISPPGSAHESQRNTEALLRAESVPPFETVRLAKGGRPVDVLISVSPVRDTAGNVSAIAAIIRDITERKRAEAERAQLAAIVENSQDAIVSTAPDRTILTWNTGAERLFGYRAEEVVGRDVSFLVPEERRHELGQRRAVALAGEQAPPHETERLAKDGRRVAVSISASPLKDGAGNVTGVALIYRDISERKRAEVERGQLAAIVENSDDAIASRDLERRILTWNAAAERLFGYSAAEVIGRNISLIIPPDQEAQAALNCALLASGQTISAYDAVRLTKDGRRIDVSVTQSPIKDAGGKMIGVSLIFRDITERKQAEEKIRRLAHYDGLTGLPNRMLFYDRLDMALALAKRERREMALLYLDLDGFKAVNDALGHEAGDELLKSVAARTRRSLRESDTVGRIGGDEFIVLLPQVQLPQDAVTVAEKLIAGLSAPFSLSGRAQEVRIGVSIGIAIYPADAQERDTLIKAADAAMYSAKQTRNSFRFYAGP